MTGFTIRILEDEKEIGKRIMRALAEDLNSFLLSVKPTIDTVVRKHLSYSISHSPEWDALDNSELQYELGIANPSTAKDAILDRILQGVVVDVKPLRFRGADFTGGVFIYAIPSDYSDLFSMQEAKIITEKGTELEWLRWLLTGGGDIIIGGYDVSFIPGKGRTGNAVMVQGGDWAIPSRYQGSSDNNFITKALEKDEAQLIQDIIACMT